MKINYYALIVAILKDCTPERAFDLLGDDYDKVSAKGARRPDITPADIADMKIFRAEGMTYREVGELYGLDFKETYYKIIRPKKGVVRA